MGFQRGIPPLAGQGQRPCGGVGAKPPQNQSLNTTKTEKNGTRSVLIKKSNEKIEDLRVDVTQ